MIRSTIWLVSSVMAHGQLLPGVDPGLPEPDPVESLPEAGERSSPAVDDDRELNKNLRRIRLETWDGAGRISDSGDRLRVEKGVLLPSPEALEAGLAPFFGEPLLESDLLEIVDQVLSHYDAEGFPVVVADVPAQDFEGGELRIVVEMGRIGRVGVAQPEYGDPEMLRDGLWLAPGDVVRRDGLDEQLEWYGRHVFRRPRLFVSPGAAPATADLLIGLEEARPWRVTAGYDNAGTDLLGRERFILGAAGVTPGDHVLAWQTVTGTPASSLTAHAASWEIPLHARHETIQLEAAYAEVLTRSMIAGLPLENEGTSWSVGAAHRFRLPHGGAWRQHATWGFELKATDQFVLFGSSSFSPGEVRLFHTKFGYELERRWESGAVSVGADVLASPGGLFAGNEDGDFKVFDAAADSAYVIGRLSGNGWWSPGGDWRLGVRGAAQVADSRLLPAEQFAAGGHGSVRGVGEREFFADTGWQGSFEVVTPPWEPFERCRLRGVGFIDHAWLRNRGGDSVSLSGAGVGLRLNVSDRVDLRLDQGWRLDAGGARTHFGLRFSY